MMAYHGDEAIKARYLARVRAHREADALTKGVGWHDGKGCAVGCTLEAYDHSLYPVELGIPESLARIEDVIFEWLPHSAAQQWPERFLMAVPVGADLSRVQWHFQRWLLADSGLLHDGGRADVREAIAATVAVLEDPCQGRPIDVSAARSAATSAASAAWSAESAESAARDSAWSEAWIKMADQLLVFLAEARS